MRRRATILSLLSLVVALAWPAGSSATAPNNQAASYGFFMEEPNVAVASHGDVGLLHEEPVGRRLVVWRRRARPGRPGEGHHEREQRQNCRTPSHQCSFLISAERASRSASV